MVEVTNRAMDVVDKIVGKAKRAIGEATDRPDIVADGDLMDA